jgi:hypothetical protein
VTRDLEVDTIRDNEESVEQGGQVEVLGQHIKESKGK